MPRSQSFQFVDDLDRIAAETSGVVEIPAGITNKGQLMQVLVRAVPLPDYFGGNWDALDECLRDRLLEDGRLPFCLLHRDLPLGQDTQDCRDYLFLLNDTLVWSKKSATCEFTVLFPQEAASAVERILGGNSTR